MCSHHLIVYQLLKKQPLSTSHQYTSTSMLSHVAVANSEVRWVRNMKSKRLPLGAIFFSISRGGGGCKWICYWSVQSKLYDHYNKKKLSNNYLDAKKLCGSLLFGTELSGGSTFFFHCHIVFGEILPNSKLALPSPPPVLEILDPPLELVVSWTRLFLFNSNSLTTDCRHFNFGLILLTKENPMIKKMLVSCQTYFRNIPTFCTLIKKLYIAFAEYYNEPIRRSFGNCDIYNTTITWLRKHDHMARYFPIFLVFGAKFQYFDNGE